MAVTVDVAMGWRHDVQLSSRSLLGVGGHVAAALLARSCLLTAIICVRVLHMLLLLLLHKLLVALLFVHHVHLVLLILLVLLRR